MRAYMSSPLRAARLASQRPSWRGVAAALVAAAAMFVAPASIANAQLDQFNLYTTRKSDGAPRFYSFAPVRLSDRFGSSKYRISAPAFLGLPAGEPMTPLNDAVTHLLPYRAARLIGQGTFPRRTVRIANRCSDLLLDVGSPRLLMLPAHQDLTAPASLPLETDHNVDHFLCYDARPLSRLPNGQPLPKFPRGMQIDMTDQFQTRRYDLKKITRLCLPVDKHEDALLPPAIGAGASATPKPITPASIRNPDTTLVCYAANIANYYIEQNGCGAVNPADHGEYIGRQSHERRFGIHTNDQFGASLVDTLSVFNPREICIPSTENVCGNGVAEAPEACDGAANSACDGLACRADCTCTPPTCGDGIANEPSEACDGSDNSACGGLSCGADCSCTPPSCGDGLVNQSIEDCDGAADAACPGACQNSICRCAGPACAADPARTIFAGPQTYPGCRYFNGDPALCDSAYVELSNGTLTSCRYAGSTCIPCEAVDQADWQCINTCLCGNDTLDSGEECDGSADAGCPGQCSGSCRCPAPSCVNSPARTFVGDTGSMTCAAVDEPSLCESLYQLDAEHHSQSCYFDNGVCAACNPDYQSGNSCTERCRCGNDVREAGEECDGSVVDNCDFGCGNDCRCLPPACTFEPTRSFVGWLNSASCADFGSDATACNAAYQVVRGYPLACGMNGGQCVACEGADTCVNTCTCGDNEQQTYEECDGSDDLWCPGLCQSNCLCAAE